LHLRSLQRSNSAFFPNGLLLLDFCITFYQEKIMKEIVYSFSFSFFRSKKRNKKCISNFLRIFFISLCCMKSTDCTLLHAVFLFSHRCR
jgi:hypothetical protein